MESCISLAVAALAGVFLVRLLLIPLRHVLRLGMHSIGGFACLWILNLAGLPLPMNGVTVLAAGTLGIPGIGLIALLELL